MWGEIVEAVPEILQGQPQGIPGTVFIHEEHARVHKAFTQELAAAVGSPCLPPGDPLMQRAYSKKVPGSMLPWGSGR